jgi:O-antigen/teichoic acid export membrane protein
VVSAICVAVVPESFILYFVGDDYAGIKNMLFYLLPGVVFFAGAITLSPLFSGRGMYHVPLIISGIILVLLFFAFEVVKTNPSLEMILIIVSAMYGSFFFVYAALLKVKDGMQFSAYLPRSQEIKEMLKFKR